MKPGPATPSRSRTGNRAKPATWKTKKIGYSTKNLGDSGWQVLFASRTLAQLLTTFVTYPEATFYQRELVEITGTGLYTVQRELARLEKVGLLIRAPHGNRVYYQANRRHPAFEDLKRVVLKTMGLGDALRQALAPLAGRLCLAWIYGSFARGEETAESDIDLLLVGDLKLREVASLLGPIGQELGRELNPVVYPPEEFKSKAKEGHHFIRAVLKSDKIFLLGDEDDLRRVVG
jgi:predicted nucleotidyltransferase